jgi:hypothetical protein
MDANNAPETDDHPDAEVGGHHDAPSTGDERVDDALGRMDDLDSADVSAHAGIYDEVHRSLAAVLDDPATVPDQ